SVFNSAAFLCVLHLPGRRRHQVRNHCHRTSGTAAHRPCLFQQHHHHCSLGKFSCVPFGECYHIPTYIRWCFAEPAGGTAYAKVRGQSGQVSNFVQIFHSKLEKQNGSKHQSQTPRCFASTLKVIC